LRLEPGSSRWFRPAAILAHSADSWFWLAGLFILWLFTFRTAGEWHVRSALLAAAIFGLAVLVMLIKFTVRRRRPEGEWGGIYRSKDPHSFPSGHAARAVLIAVIFWGIGPIWLAIVTTIWAPFVILARVSTGVHFLVDVLAGALLGLAAGLIALQIHPLLMTIFPFIFA
jgi:membrane-associated phospholipid phosphatase